MAAKLTEATLHAGGVLATRLTDMRGSNLAAEHQAWLDQLIARAGQLTDVQIWIYGFSSTSGDASYNRQLSRERAWAVRDYINARSNWLTARITRFDSTGEDANAEFGRDPSKEKDPDDFRWRAVEVHLLGGHKPAPKPNVDPVPPHVLPGASLQWGVGSGGSFSFTVPGTGFASVGLSLFVFEKFDADRGKGLYVSAPVGMSLSAGTLLKLLKMKPLLNPDKTELQELLEAMAKAVVTGAIKGSLFPGSTKKVKVQNAFRHKDLGGAGLAQGEALAGRSKMISLSGKLPTFNDHGKIVHFTTKTFFEEMSDSIPFVARKPGSLDVDFTIGKFTAGGLLRIAWLT